MPAKDGSAERIQRNQSSHVRVWLIAGVANVCLTGLAIGLGALAGVIRFGAYSNTNSVMQPIPVASLPDVQAAAVLATPKVAPVPSDPVGESHVQPVQEVRAIQKPATATVLPMPPVSVQGPISHRTEFATAELNGRNDKPTVRARPTEEHPVIKKARAAAVASAQASRRRGYDIDAANKLANFEERVPTMMLNIAAAEQLGGPNLYQHPSITRARAAAEESSRVSMRSGYDLDAVSTLTNFEDSVPELMLAIARAENVRRDSEGAPANPPEVLQPQDAASYIRRGSGYLASKDYDRAISDFSEAGRLKPDDAEPYFGRAAAWRGKGERDKAIADFAACIRINPQHAWAFIGRAESLSLKGDYDNALADLGKAIELDPNNPRAYDERAVVWQLKKDYDKSIADLNVVLRLDPSFEQAYLHRGYAHYAKKRYDKASVDFSQAIRLNPGNSFTYSNRGDSYFATRNYDKALADYTEAIRIEPENAGYYARRAAAWRAKENTTEAVADEKTAARLTPN